MGAIIKNFRSFIAKNNIIISPIINVGMQPFLIYNLNQRKWWNDNIENIWDAKIYLFLYLLLILIILYNIGIAYIKMDFKNLEEKLEKSNQYLDFVLAQIQSCIDNSLIEFSRKMKLEQESEKQDRISIFGLKNVNNKKSFFGISRYSENPNYRGLSNKEYDTQKGCMAKGYCNGWHIEKGNVASFEENPKEYENYFRQHYGLSHADVRNLSMKSRYYASVSIKRGAEEKGVLVFESLQADRFDEDMIRPELENLANKISDLMELLEMKEEKVSQAVMKDINNLVKNSRGIND